MEVNMLSSVSKEDLYSTKSTNESVCITALECIWSQ